MSAVATCPNCNDCATFAGDTQNATVLFRYSGLCASMGNHHLTGRYLILTKDATLEPFHLDEVRPEIMVPKFEGLEGYAAS